MKALFNRNTFRYFDLAKKNKKKQDWFKKNRGMYDENVREPFEILVREMERKIQDKLPGIVISPKKLVRPMRSKNKAEVQGWTRASCMFFFSERQTSMFEWNPGLFMQLGDEKEDNVIGMGLYGPSSRQIKRLRAAFAEDHETVDRLLADRKLRKYWGGPAQELYKRFPKDYSPEDPAAKYIWYKQFFLRQQFTRKETMEKGFADHVLKSFDAGVPLFQWIRNAIGVYDKREMQRLKDEREAGW